MKKRQDLCRVGFSNEVFVANRAQVGTGEFDIHLDIIDDHDLVFTCFVAISGCLCSI